ncbi:MAG: hypothetical protein HZT40_08150 [Candidatus Thiothrix singaporensis]|uniref:Uncharacterized protein n=1 Tax=Candidatus Thiothrix singaporensis TaxID=2799669 RepID=A0A7L6AQY5_9GAMM|nr:MAG: hypothetical protein HZT40_08150 [Candidatus Thiothrix singaporensis]
MDTDKVNFLFLGAAFCVPASWAADVAPFGLGSAALAQALAKAPPLAVSASAVINVAAKVLCSFMINLLKIVMNRFSD